MRIRRGSRPALALVVVVIGVVVAACGSGGTAQSESASSGAAKSPQAHTAAATIKILAESGVGSPLGSYPGDWGGPQAAALAINKAGGINGAKLDVITCQDNITANGAAACAREAVADKVAAVVGWTGFDPEFGPIVAAAHIPVIQWVISDFDAVLSAKATWSDQFPLNGGAFPEWVGEVYAAKAAGAKTVAFVVVNFPGISTVVAQEKAAALKLGLKVAGTVNTVETQTTFATSASQLAALKPDAVLLNATSPQEDAILEAAQGIGFSPIWISDGGTFNPETFAAWAKLAPKEWMSSSVPFANDNEIAGIKALNSEMNAAVAAGISNAAVGNRDESTVYSWLATHAFADVAKTIKGPVTAASVMAALKATKNLNVEGIEDYSPATTGLASWPRVTSGGLAYIGPVKNGVYVPTARPAVLKGL